MSKHYITVLDSEVATDLEGGGLVQVVSPGASANAAFSAAAAAADREHTQLRVCVLCGHDRQGIKLGGKVYDITTAVVDWDPVHAKFGGIVIISVGGGIAYPALTKAEVDTQTDGVAYCFAIASIAGAPVFASEAEQNLKLEGGKATMTPWAGAVWRFEPDGVTRSLLRGRPLPYPPPN
jgi:hypothetical protein